MSEKLSVLLIEDDVHDVEAVERALKTVQPSLFDLRHVTKFRDAIHAIQTESFHVVILDLGLPDCVGLNGVERLMALIPTVPVIVLTGVDDEETSLKGIGLGAQEFLDKNNVTPKELIRTIRHATKRKQFSIQQPSPSEGRQGTKLESAADASAAARLTAIMKDTAELMTTHTTALLSTELTEQQRSIVSEIEETSQKSFDAAQKANSRGGYSSADGNKYSPKETAGDEPPTVGRIIDA